jgi:pimeloyl-ACP methyl ester carboxylesterase
MQFVEASGLQDFHLLGLSLGALVSAAYATQHGERIASLTVMCPPGKSKYKIFWHLEPMNRPYPSGAHGRYFIAV